MNLSALLKSLVNLIVGVVVVLLGLRFILRLFSANPNNGFVEWIYNSSSEIMGPFRGIFPSANIEGSIFEFSALFAILIYGIIGMLAIYLIEILTPRKSK